MWKEVLPAAPSSESSAPAWSADLVSEALRRELGQLEDEAAATAWAWNETISQRVDWLIVALEERHA